MVVSLKGNHPRISLRSWRNLWVSWVVDRSHTPEDISEGGHETLAFVRFGPCEQLPHNHAK